MAVLVLMLLGSLDQQALDKIFIDFRAKKQILKATKKFFCWKLTKYLSTCHSAGVKVSLQLEIVI